MNPARDNILQRVRAALRVEAHRPAAPTSAPIFPAVINPEVRFREEFVSEIRPILVVCGEVNQKNHTAGYTGYQRFISGPEFIALESAVGAEIMTQMWSAMCRRKP